MNRIETEVLIVGSGPAGLSAALFLSEYGIENVMVERYRWLAHTPRAHITNQRAVEILRDMGLEDEVVAKATPQELMGNQVFCTSLAGEELARMRSWGTEPRRRAEYELASPSRMCDLPQTLLEPILLEAAAARGTEVRFRTEYLSLTQDDDGVTALVRDRTTGEEYEIRSHYLLGADGSRSRVADDIGLPMEGRMAVAGSMNILIEADLSHLVEDRPSVLYWVMQPGSTIGGVGMGVVRMVRPWNEWLLIWGYDINAPAPEVDEAEAHRIARRLIGDDTVPIEVKDISLWTNNRAYMTRYSTGRVFCMGDACHRHPPNNGLGANTSIQDSYNLSWKLAAVLRDKADDSLLTSYDEERVPVGRQVVERANKSIEEFGAIFDAFGLTGSDDADQMLANMAGLKAATPAAAEQRRRLRDAMKLKSYEFNAHGVEFNQRYRSGAIVGDGTPEPEYDRDSELFYQPTTWPGARLPHAWLLREGNLVSTLDLAGKGRFALLTGLGGEAWLGAAEQAQAETAVEIVGYLIGPGRELVDAYGEWADLSEVEDSGCVLVRPDLHVAWRSKDLGEDAAAELTSVMRRLLGRADQKERADERIEASAAS